MGTPVITQEIPLRQLILDPNNYRLQDGNGFKVTTPDRFALDAVQRATFLRLRSEGLKELRDSIIANGFLPIERIVVTVLDVVEGQPRYLVIEGNRRVAALKQIQTEVDGGIDIPANVIATLAAVPCVVAEQEGEEAFFKEKLMGIRHVGGIRQWGGYQRAKLITDLRDVHHLDAAEVSARLGLSANEVNRRYRAFKALQQMRADDEFADFAEPSLYPMFHEAIAVPAVRDWLGWNAELCKFENAEQLELFYKLVTPSVGQEDQPERAAKLKTFSDIRELKNVLPNLDAKRVLLDPDKPFVEAVAIASNKERSRKWRDEISEAITSLNGISAIEVREFSDEDIRLLDELIRTSSEMRTIYDRLHVN